MVNYITISLVSLFTSIVLGYVFIKIKWPKKLLDYPCSRKIHDKPTPLIGGIMVFLTFLSIFMIFGLYTETNILLLTCFYFIFLLIGLIDDFSDLSYSSKIIYQLVGALLFIYIIPIDISRITFSTIELKMPIINLALLTLWIVGTINAFNFFDGINTLAGGMAIIIFSSYAIITQGMQTEYAVIIYLILIFTIIGFLFYNRTPAKMFLGDAGSMSIGFLLAVLPLFFQSNNGTGINVTVPVIITSLLTLETVYLIYMRLKNKKSPFHPDKLHLHHKLLSLNLRNRYVVLIICFSTLLLSIFACNNKYFSFYQIVLIEFLFFMLIIVLPRYLKKKISITTNKIL